MSFHLASCGLSQRHRDAPVTEACDTNCPRRLHAYIAEMEATLYRATAALANPECDNRHEETRKAIVDLLIPEEKTNRALDELVRVSEELGLYDDTKEK